MNLRFLSFFAVVALALPSLRAAENDKEVEARKVALELAGAFSNDGFKIRDGHWSGTVKGGERALVAVNLYAGNQYWFSVGADDKAAKLAVRLHDENGKPLTVEDYQGDATAAAGFSPTVSGQYFISVAPDATDAAGTYCLVYSYK
jgi:hypothetical protein